MTVKQRSSPSYLQSNITKHRKAAVRTPFTPKNARKSSEVRSIEGAPFPCGHFARSISRKTEKLMFWKKTFPPLSPLWRYALFLFSFFSIVYASLSKRKKGHLVFVLSHPPTKYQDELHPIKKLDKTKKK